MKTVTVDQFLSFRPCWGEKRVREFAGDKNEWTALDVLKAEDVSAENKLWAVLREDFIAAPILHEFACRCAENALKLVDNPDPHSVNAIAVKRRWMRGEATDKDLAVARAAVWAAASAAASAAARDTAWAAAWAAAMDASAAAMDASAVAMDAAWAAAMDAAWAARAAASAAASAAARNTAWAAAWAAARAAAWAAARDAQVQMLIEMLEAEENE